MTVVDGRSVDVWVDVSAARAGVRETISWDGPPRPMNPGEAARVAEDLRIAADIVDKLCPAPALNGSRRQPAAQP